MAAAGHEIAVHGWLHRPLLPRGPRAVYDDLAGARETVASITGNRPTRFRPPCGVMSASARLAARRLGLSPGTVDLLGRGPDGSGHTGVGSPHGDRRPGRRWHDPAPRLGLHLRSGRLAFGPGRTSPHPRHLRGAGL
ncbi:polysaccharide deacetylase family protein [Streptomyces sp. NPDC006309]|uniref:polysaccharide deacetylase family protein n=1 Tax=Streptomyces sp. NPDC006309 TaxID=3156749 RepID=UPI00339DE0BF